MPIDYFVSEFWKSDVQIVSCDIESGISRTVFFMKSLELTWSSPVIKDCSYSSAIGHLPTSLQHYFHHLFFIFRRTFLRDCWRLLWTHIHYLVLLSLIALNHVHLQSLLLHKVTYCKDSWLGWSNWVDFMYPHSIITPLTHALLNIKT